MVAAAGTVEGTPRKYTIPLLAFTVFALAAVIPIREGRTAFVHAPLDRSPEVLAHESRTLAAQFGYTAPPADSHTWLDERGQLINYLWRMPKPHLWEKWYAAASPLRATYRESPRPLVATPDGGVTESNPPADVPGMVRVVLDANGRLLLFEAVANDALPTLTEPVAAATVFQAAGLNLAEFRETDPTGATLTGYDQRRYWRGLHPQLPNTELRVDVAWWKGRVTHALVSYPFTTQAAATPEKTSFSANVRTWLMWVLEGVGAFFVILMARHNWKRNRADLRGAWIVAGVRMVCSAINWAGWTHPVEGDALLSNFLGAAGSWLLSGAIIWMIYMALEPAVRSRWPHSIVTWNRVLAGRWSDPQVGSEILLGAAVGSGMWMAFKLLNYALGGNTEPTNTDFGLFTVLGTRQWVGAHASILGNALRTGIIVFMAVFGLRSILRRDWLAVLAASALFTMSEGEPMRSEDWITMTLLFMAIYAVLIYLLLRWGLVASITTIFFVNAFNNITLGTNLKTWYTPAGLSTFLLLLGIAVYAFWRSLGGRELIGDNPT